MTSLARHSQHTIVTMLSCRDRLCPRRRPELRPCKDREVGRTRFRTPPKKGSLPFEDAIPVPLFVMLVRQAGVALRKLRLVRTSHILPYQNRLGQPQALLWSALAAVTAPRWQRLAYAGGSRAWARAGRGMRHALHATECENGQLKRT